MLTTRTVYMGSVVGKVHVVNEIGWPPVTAVSDFSDLYTEVTL